MRILKSRSGSHINNPIRFNIAFFAATNVLAALLIRTMPKTSETAT
jgi:hypothetical protein